MLEYLLGILPSSSPASQRPSLRRFADKSLQSKSYHVAKEDEKSHLRIFIGGSRNNWPGRRQTQKVRILCVDCVVLTVRPPHVQHWTWWEHKAAGNVGMIEEVGHLKAGRKANVKGHLAVSRCSNSDTLLCLFAVSQHCLFHCVFRIASTTTTLSIQSPFCLATGTVFGKICVIFHVVEWVTLSFVHPVLHCVLQQAWNCPMKQKIDNNGIVVVFKWQTKISCFILVFLFSHHKCATKCCQVKTCVTINGWLKLCDLMMCATLVLEEGNCDHQQEHPNPKDAPQRLGWVVGWFPTNFWWRLVRNHRDPKATSSTNQTCLTPTDKRRTMMLLLSNNAILLPVTWRALQSR